MKTECKPESLAFHPLGRREVVARFDGGRITSDAGGLLLRETERLTRILRQFAGCYTDHRDPDRIEHTVEELIAQRVYGLALGYEDLNDHDDLRHDPLMAVLVGKDDPMGNDRHREQDRGKALAGKSTLNRLELTPTRANAKSRYKNYCYLPLYIFCGEHLLCARLRPADIDGAAGSVKELKQIVAQIRARWPHVQIVIRADSGFCREPIMTWCEANGVEYVLGLAKNDRLIGEIGEELKEAKQQFQETGQAARVFKDFSYQTLTSWSQSRRVIGKAEHLPKGSNPRFVVTTLSAEAYVLLAAIRRLRLGSTKMAHARCDTIRLKLLKIGAQVRVTVRKVWVRLAESCPYRAIFEQVYAVLRQKRPQPFP